MAPTTKRKCKADTTALSQPLKRTSKLPQGESLVQFKIGVPAIPIQQTQATTPTPVLPAPIPVVPGLMETSSTSISSLAFLYPGDVAYYRENQFTRF